MNITAISTLTRREVIRILRIWPQTLLPPMITMSLYFIIFGNLIGSKIGQMQGFDYITFIIPGLIMMAVISNSYANVVSSFFSAKFQRNIEEIIISPMSYHEVILGFISGGIIRGLLIAVIVTIISLMFTRLPIHNFLIIFVTILLTAALFSLGGFLNALFARKFDDISIFPTFILSPLTYLGGVFYSIEMLPEFWQQLSKINPILYMINAFRYGFLGISDISIGFTMASLCVFVLLLYFYCYYLLKKGKAIMN